MILNEPVANPLTHESGPKYRGGKKPGKTTKLKSPPRHSEPVSWPQVNVNVHMLWIQTHFNPPAHGTHSSELERQNYPRFGQQQNDFKRGPLDRESVL